MCFQCVLACAVSTCSLSCLVLLLCLMLIGVIDVFDHGQSVWCLSVAVLLFHVFCCHDVFDLH